MSSPEIVVSGGAGGLEADLEDLATLGRSSTELAEMLAMTSAACHTMLLDPDLLASAALDPAGVARFDAALLEALDGPRGLTALAVTFAGRAVVLQSARAAYEVADAALAELADDLRWATGFFWPVTVVGLVVAGAGRATVDPVGTGMGIAALLDDPGRWITEHPGVVDGVLGAAPGAGTMFGAVVPGVSPWTGGGDVSSSARRLGRLWPDGTPVVEGKGVERSGPAARPPRGIDDLLSAVDARSRQAGEHHDRISVRVITHADGTTAYVVDIPGTKHTALPTGSVHPQTNDLGTNLRVLGGDVTTRQRAIAEALRLAGARNTDPVMLVGHSQGGMVAAQAASDAGTPAFDYDVRSVVTAGSPIGRVDVPGSVQLLALENAHDIVPHLDSRANDDASNVTTVTFSAQEGGIGQNHGIESGYRAAARAVDSSDDPSLEAFRASADPFLVGPGDEAAVVGHVYEISRR
jgi:pimeloyl-ACP methyl ester carboxylesterase